MENRFTEMNARLKEACRTTQSNTADRLNGLHSRSLSKSATRQTSHWSRTQSATDRVLVILIENGGIDLVSPRWSINS